MVAPIAGAPLPSTDSPAGGTRFAYDASVSEEEAIKETAAAVAASLALGDDPDDGMCAASGAWGEK